jgi:hypothetical protein
MDIHEGRPLARTKDKYRRVCRKLIHHHAYRTRPHFGRSRPNARFVATNSISILVTI